METYRFPQVSSMNRSIVMAKGIMMFYILKNYYLKSKFLETRRYLRGMKSKLQNILYEL